MLGQVRMETVCGNRVKVGSVYTIYTKYPEPSSHTLHSDENIVSPLLEETDKLTCMLNPKFWRDQLTVLRREKMGGSIIVINNRDQNFLSHFTLN